MPLTQGRYAPMLRSTRREMITSRLRWLRGKTVGFFLYPPWQRHPEDTGEGFQLNREWGFWTVRPHRGWRSIRWISPAVHATRRIRRDDNDAAELWAAQLLGIPV